MSNGKVSAGQVTRRELFDRAWSKPMTTNADELGTTAPALSTLARKLGLPLPQAGHWMKKERGKEAATPSYPADPTLDGELYAIPPLPEKRFVRPRTSHNADEEIAEATKEDKSSIGDRAPVAHCPVAAKKIDVSGHKRVASTRNAILKSLTADRFSIQGRGKFRLLVSPSCGERACVVLDTLVAAAEAERWLLESDEKGYAIVAEDESISFMIEEKLERVPHVITAAERKEQAEYERKCALADRGVGYRPWRAPSIPDHDYVPSGDLVLKFDHDYAAGGTRRTFSDGKRQRLEDLVPSMIDALTRWAIAVKARREEIARQKKDWAEQERRRADRERQVRVEGYRITFLQRQIERQREIDGLSSLLASWQKAEDVDPKFAELMEFAHLYQNWLEAKIAPTAIAERIADLKLMDDDVYIYDAKRLD